MMRSLSIIILHLLPLATAGAEGFRPVPINPGPPLNGNSSDFAPALTEDGKTLYFNSKRDGTEYQDLFVSEYRHGAWTLPLPVQELNSPFNDETPYIDPSGRMILFASDRDGSAEVRTPAGVRISFDLYISFNKEGHWTKPVPVPGDVNSIEHERAPSMGIDGRTLYYTSYPFGMDEDSVILSARWTEEGFRKTGPLPPAINSGNAERGLIEAEDGYYFSSKRPGGFGGWDIYHARMERDLEWKVVNLGPLINGEASEFYFTRNRNGAFFCSDRRGGLGHFDIYSASFSIPATYFRYDSSDLTKEAAAVLDGIVQFLMANPLLRFEIVGHTDLHGDESYNLELSLNRANSVKDFLINRGILEKRLTVRGAGISEPVINNVTPEADQKNRRTEFRLLDFGRAE